MSIEQLNKDVLAQLGIPPDLIPAYMISDDEPQGPNYMRPPVSPCPVQIDAMAVAAATQTFVDATVGFAADFQMRIRSLAR